MAHDKNNSYPGGKNGSGVYQKIISMMPMHDCYYELFLGHGAIFRKKKPANRINIGVEIDKSLEGFWKENSAKDCIVVFDDAKSFLEKTTFAENSLIYLDPPYLKDVRKSKQPIYNFEMLETSQHIALLEKLVKLPCMVMISGYESKLYDDYLQGWRKETFYTTNRASQKVLETVWLNFPKPFQLHDYSFLGENYRERDRIKQKRKRWKNRLLKLDSTEMFALLATIEDLKTEVSSKLMLSPTVKNYA